MISAARMATTSNPFVMYDFFNTVQKIIEPNNFTASQIWNCDETDFPTDAGQCKVIAPRGKQPNKRTSGAGRENISVLATCSASGKALDSFIIFSAVNFQSTWRGRNPLPNAYYDISKNGWMTTEIFASWFQNGHLTHVSLELIEKAIEEKITIVKLPPHVTDRLQPLDVCCFDALKREWENKLNERMNLLGPRETISKSVLVDALSNIWHKSLSEKNIVSGFRATGKFPLNREKYPQDRFDQRLLKRYENWVRLGKPEDNMEDLSTAVVTPTKGKFPEPEIDHSFAEDQNHSECIAALSSQLQSTSLLSINEKKLLVPMDTSTHQPLKSPCYCSELGPMPLEILDETWVPAWTLRDNKSFGELVLDKLKGPTEKPPVKRRKTDKKTKLITDEVYAQEIRQIHEKETQKKSTSTKQQKKKR